MNKDLISFISSLESNVKAIQNDFYQYWNDQIKSCFFLDCKFDIREYIDNYGGFWLDYNAYNNINNSLKGFFDKRIKHEKKVYLRGYDYYVFDPILNLRTTDNSHTLLWKTFRHKWESYKQIISYSFINQSMGLENWIAALGYLEYIFSDLTSIQWFVYRNRQDFLCINSFSLQALEKDIETLIDYIGATIADLLTFKFDSARQLLQSKCTALFYSKPINNLLYTDFGEISKASMRTMREGDSLVLVYAAYVLKLKPYCINKCFNRIQIVSNAFGAMNSGIIIKHLLASTCLCSHMNILYAQHRSEGDAVYSDKLLNKCYVINVDQDNNGISFDAKIVIDDSICLGRSFYKIKEFLGSSNVLMLPLTLNCNGMKYFRVGVNSTDDVSQLIHNSVFLSKEINDTLPAFFSYWDFRRVVPKDTKFNDENYNFAMYGSDMLLRHLWMLYENEITSNFLNSKD